MFFINTIARRFYAVPSGGSIADATVYYAGGGGIDVAIIPGQLAACMWIAFNGDSGLDDIHVIPIGAAPDPVFSVQSFDVPVPDWRIGIGGFTGDGSYRVDNSHTYGPFIVIVGDEGTFLS